MTDYQNDLRPRPSHLRPVATDQSRPNPRRGSDWSESEVSDSSPAQNLGRQSDRPRAKPITAGAAARTTEFAIVTVCVSTNPDALRALDAAVAKLKRAGIRAMNRSWLLRIALERLDVDAVLEDLKRVTR